MAAHLEGKGVTGARHGGPGPEGRCGLVACPHRRRPGQLWAPRIAAGEADAVIGCDIVVTVGDESLAKMQLGRTRAVVNSDSSVTSEFVRTVAEQARDRRPRPLPRPASSRPRPMEDQIVDAVGARTPPRSSTPSRLATTLHGRRHRHQHVHARLRVAAGPGAALARRRSSRAIELNGAAVGLNQAAFHWGRRAGARPGGGRARWPHRRGAGPEQSAPVDEPGRGDRAPGRVSDRLSGRRLCRAATRRWSSACAAPRPSTCPGSTALTEAVARNYAQAAGLQGRVRGRPALHRDRLPAADRVACSRATGSCASIWPRRCWQRPDPVTGEPKKRAYGQWMLRRLPRARAAQAPARHAARPVRLHGRPARRAPADPRLRGADRGDPAAA